MTNPLKRKTIVDRVSAWVERKKLDRIMHAHGGYQMCPWCRQCAQGGPGWNIASCQQDPFLDILTCGVCGGTSLWHWEMSMLYVAPLDPPIPDWKPDLHHDITKATEWAILSKASEVSILKNEITRLRAGAIKVNQDICQTLGKALGYPWFKDDQKNFPGATEKEGVCVGEHVAETLAIEAADKIAALKTEREKIFSP